MPVLDRRITVRRSVSDFNIYGEPETIVTDWPVWATRLDASLLDAAQAGGQLDTASRTYIIRWRGRSPRRPRAKSSWSRAARPSAPATSLNRPGSATLAGASFGSNAKAR